MIEKGNIGVNLKAKDSHIKEMSNKHIYIYIDISSSSKGVL
jgi:hypothetical protein